jgi:hypothetical protein
MYSSSDSILSKYISTDYSISDIGYRYAYRGTVYASRKKYILYYNSYGIKCTGVLLV